MYVQSSVSIQSQKMLYNFILEFFTARVIDVHCECWTWWHTITVGTGFIVCVLSIVSVNSIPLAQDSLFVCCECLTANHLHRIHCLCIVSVDSIPLAQDSLFCVLCLTANHLHRIHCVFVGTVGSKTLALGYTSSWRIPAAMGHLSMGRKWVSAPDLLLCEECHG